MVYYRKYRPQTIAELDLESVRIRLSSILNAKELPHAFLFTGPKGLGKTSSARILAKAINCENKKGIEPCNKCDVCVSITNGSNIDVLEIDAASNRGIDEIRDLRDKIKYAPAQLTKKVYIIDEVHMLTTDAFNALLKTLEEPPSHAVFILATTEVEKVPATIVSRTFQVTFQKPTKEEILNSLDRIVKGEKLDIDSKVLDEVYKLSEGAFRDAAKILEELSIGSNNSKITLETLNSTYKTANLETEIRSLLENLAKKDLQRSIQIVEELADKGADFKVVTERIAQAIHDILMLRAGISFDIPDIKEFETTDLKKLLNEVNDSYGKIKFSVLQQIPLELVVIGWCIEENSKFKTQNAKLDQEETEEQAEVRESPKIEQKIEEKVEVREEPKEEPVSNESNHGGLFSESSKPDNFLAAFLFALKQDNHSIAGVLRGCKLIEITDTEVVFETRFKFHRDKLTEAKTAAVLDKRASDLLHQKVKVVVNLVEK